MRTRREMTETAATVRDLIEDLPTDELRDVSRALNRELRRRNAEDAREARTREMEAGGRAYLDGPYVEQCEEDF